MVSLSLSLNLFCYPSLSFRLFVATPVSEIIRAERLQVRDVSSRSASLHWRPVLAGSGYYDITFGPIPSGAETSPGGGPGTSPGTSPGHYQRITRPGDATNAQLTGLRPGTKYKVTLRPESNLNILKTLTTDFTTQPGERSGKRSMC